MANRKIFRIKNHVLLIALPALMLAGCTKDGTISTPSCQRNNHGTLLVRSVQDEAFHIYLNGGYKGTVGAFQTVSYANLTPATYTFEAKEVDYTFFQDTYNASVTVTQCQSFTVQF